MMFVVEGVGAHGDLLYPLLRQVRFGIRTVACLFPATFAFPSFLFASLLPPVSFPLDALVVALPVYALTG